MITGAVNSDREAVILLKIQGANGQEQEINAVIDTGFNGFLTLPLSVITALGCSYLSQGYVILADGRIEQIDIYETLVNWDGLWIAVETDAADSVPLVGMELMDRYELNVQAVDGGTVTLIRM